ncbi:MAG TPA: hypothetical protein VLT47_04115 [Anaeromyxobacteraceae bacterium]|nr:hypothetical protein [Anaeromyxobacteraceae bacterium]
MRALPLLAAALGACASVPTGPPPPSPEQAFRGVKGVALVHRLESGDGRRHDPLDALQAALEGRGIATVPLDLPRRPAAPLEAVDRLARAAEGRAGDARTADGAPAVSSLGGDAEAVLRALGVEALAVYVRAPGWGSLPPPGPSPFVDPMALAPRPTLASAIALVARDGTLVTFTWGGGAERLGDGGPANAAEAIDAALALLAPAPTE